MSIACEKQHDLGASVFAKSGARTNRALCIKITSEHYLRGEISSAPEQTVYRQYCLLTCERARGIERVVTNTSHDARAA